MPKFEAGNQHAAAVGNAGNRMGRPKTARTIRRETLKELRFAAAPLISRAVQLALAGSEPAICAVIGLLAAGYGDLPEKSAKGANGDAVEQAE